MMVDHFSVRIVEIIFVMIVLSLCLDVEEFKGQTFVVQLNLDSHQLFSNYKVKSRESSFYALSLFYTMANKN